MENLSVSSILDTAFHFYPHNESYATPGLYDLKLEDVTWALSATLIFFTMQTGLAMIEAGIISKKNQVNVMMKNIVDVCAGGLSFWIFGFGLMFGRGELTNGFFGAGDFFVNAKVTDPLMGQIFILYFFQMSFATTSTTIVSAAIAERCKITAYILFSFLSTFVYAVGAGWIWGSHGWLKNIGVVDFAGSGPIHVIAGAASFVGAWFIGPRLGRYNNGTKPLPMSEPVTVCIGTFIIWWGWIGFNAGSSYGVTGGKWEFAARAGAGTTLASMSAGMTSIFFSLAKNNGKIDVLEVLCGILCGLVSINCGCFMFSMYSAIIVGAVAALLCLIIGPLIDRMKVDDAVGCTAVHLTGGIWGQIAVGLFADPPTGPKGIFLGGGPNQLIVQAISSIALTVWAALSTLLILCLVNGIIPMRLSPEDEKKGCDLVEHNIGENNCNELQKTTNTFDKYLIEVATPIAQRFNRNNERNQSGSNSEGRRRNFRDNQGYESGDDKC